MTKLYAIFVIVLVGFCAADHSQEEKRSHNKDHSRHGHEHEVSRHHGHEHENDRHHADEHDRHNGHSRIHSLLNAHSRHGANDRHGEHQKTQARHEANHNRYHQKNRDADSTTSDDDGEIAVVTTENVILSTEVPPLGTDGGFGGDGDGNNGNGNDGDGFENNNGNGTGENDGEGEDDGCTSYLPEDSDNQADFKQGSLAYGGGWRTFRRNNPASEIERHQKRHHGSHSRTNAHQRHENHKSRNHHQRSHGNLEHNARHQERQPQKESHGYRVRE